MAQSNSKRLFIFASTLALFSAAVFWNHFRIPALDEHPEEEEEHEEFVVLTSDQRQQAGIKMHSIQPGYLQNVKRAHGTIILNKNEIAHVIPKVVGIVQHVHANEGDKVKKGKTLAVLESREIAEAKSEYLGALRKEKIALELLEMEQRLKDKRMTSTPDFQNAYKEASATQYELELAQQKLYALGLTRENIEQLETSDPSSLLFYEIKSPLSGTILQRHATLGEFLSSSTEAFVVANLDNLWIEIFVSPRDLPDIAKGKEIKIFDSEGNKGVATICNITPVLDDDSRKAKAIAVLDNKKRKWNAGTYVTVEIKTDKQPIALMVPSQAVQTIEGTTCVFVEADGGFEIRPVETGLCDGKRTEILSGAALGEKVAATNTFLLKADHLKNEAEHEH